MPLRETSKTNGDFSAINNQSGCSGLCNSSYIVAVKPEAAAREKLPEGAYFDPTVGDGRQKIITVAEMDGTDWGVDPA